ncbi:MAG: hypothetical protein KDC13_04105 [Bacteroidetes bacterium]|nr:hypothetical protein [Bacteroidota bacterium]
METKRIYSSFEEIDRELEILDTERKLKYYRFKRNLEGLKTELSAERITTELFEEIQQRFMGLLKSIFTQRIIVLVIRSLFKWFK